MKSRFGIFLCFCLLIFAACSSERSMVSEIKVCPEFTNHRCQTHVEIFSPQTPEIFASSIANNLPADSTATFVWSFATNGKSFQEIKRFGVTPGNQSEILSSSLSKLDSLWPVGTYQVELIFSGIEITPLTSNFVIKSTREEM